MCASAMASRWAVETPGRSSASIRSRTSADDPAGAAHPLDLGARLAGDHRQTAPAPLSASHQRVGDRRRSAAGRRPCVRTPRRAVVVDDLEERRDLLRHPRPDGRLLVVGALDELGAVEVAHGRRSRGGFETRL